MNVIHIIPQFYLFLFSSQKIGELVAAEVFPGAGQA